MNVAQLKYGHTRGGSISVPCPLAASQVFVAASSRFVYLDGSGHAVVADDGANEIFGHAEAAAGIYSSTAAKDVVNVVIDPSAVFRIPVIAGTYVITMRGKTCDLLVTGGIQGADLTAADDDVLVIVDGDAVDNLWVDVMINQKERCQSGVV